MLHGTIPSSKNLRARNTLSRASGPGPCGGGAVRGGEGGSHRPSYSGVLLQPAFPAQGFIHVAVRQRFACCISLNSHNSPGGSSYYLRLSNEAQSRSVGKLPVVTVVGRSQCPAQMSATSSLFRHRSDSFTAVFPRK